MDGLIFIVSFLSGVVLFQGSALIFLFIELKSMQKSTHSVQYIDPLEQTRQEFAKLSEEDKKKLEGMDLFGNLN